MKKLMLLGGLRYLIPVIKTAQKMGCYVITCDFKPDNIAHKYSDEYHDKDILDKHGILELAKSLKIDGIMSFAVDPGVVTAAYVSNKMGLSSPGPYQSVKILQNKALFRKFLEDNNFRVPKSKSYSDIQTALKQFDYFELPVIVKPVDSAGSKGVSKVNHYNELQNAFSIAINNSYSKTFIIEDFLESKGFSSDSDSFSVDGEFQIISFSNQRFDASSPNPYTPAAYSWPSDISIINQYNLKSELQRLIQLLDMKTSVYNIEVRETIDGEAYIMEVSPRGGGNRLSEMLHYATGINLIEKSIQAALGQPVRKIKEVKYKGHWAEIILYSNNSGIFRDLQIAPKLKNYLVETDLWINKGEKINAFTGANEAIGTLVFDFDTKKNLDLVLSNYSKFIKVNMEE